MIKVPKEDAYSLGILYVYLYSNGMQKIVSENALKEFHSCIEYNLDLLDKGANFLSTIRYEKTRIYDYSLNEQGKGYYILKSDFDMSKAKSDYIGLVPIDYLVASQMDNSLDCLGLVKENGSIKIKRDALTRKHDGECCKTCEYNISPELLEDIRRENIDYEDLSDSEFLDLIGYCEFEQDHEKVRKMGYWCPKYTENENLRKKEYIKRKLN